MSAVLREVGTEAAITERRGVSSTEYQIVGTLHSVLMAIEGLFAEYPAAGYGTFVHSIRLGDSANYNARVSHSNSCE